MNSRIQLCLGMLITLIVLLGKVESVFDYYDMAYCRKPGTVCSYEYQCCSQICACCYVPAPHLWECK
ncbi:unnamed protein product [Allacma fusca]|uniref:Uncharacterized protein n=1 Tax=Allacma fusca TaxID=39272 RepID=A0A8J2KK68_9HEXA|nr:unnamed protein product [Allacma fusca]